MARHAVVAEVAGTVFRVDAAVGAKVEEGDSVVTLESMKVEIPVSAPAGGTVAEILVEEGDQVSDGDEVAVVEG